MATKKITELDEATSVAVDDIVPVVTDPGGTPATEKVELGVLVGVGSLVGTYASRPAAGYAGRRFYATDGYNEWIDDGADWRPIIGGVLGTQPIAASNFTLLQAGGASDTSFTDDAGALKFTWTTTSPGGEYVRLVYKDAPADGASGYRITAHFRTLYSVNSTGAFLFGFTYRQSSNGSVELLEWTFSPNGAGGTINSFPHMIRYTANNTSNTPTYGFSTQTSSTAGDTATDIWLRTERYTNGDRKFYVSWDGVNFREIPGLGSTGNTFITPDQVGIHCWLSNNNNNSGYLQGCVIDSYKEEAF